VSTPAPYVPPGAKVGEAVKGPRMMDASRAKSTTPRGTINDGKTCHLRRPAVYAPSWWGANDRRGSLKRRQVSGDAAPVEEGASRPVVRTCYSATVVRAAKANEGTRQSAATVE
jgi:hypothetical protein